MLTDGATRTLNLAQRLGLDDPSVFGQFAAGAGFAALVAVIVRFNQFMRSWMTLSIGQAPASAFVRLQSGGAARWEAHAYMFVLVVLFFVLCAAMVRIQRLRSRQRIGGRGAASLALVGMLAVVTLALDLWPYRVLIKSSMPRLDVGGERCFLLGEAGDELLIHCPDRVPPRNRVIKRSDPSVLPRSVTESIFDPPKKSS